MSESYTKQLQRVRDASIQIWSLPPEDFEAIQALLTERDRIYRELEEAKAEVAACLDFLDTEMGWEYFRVEQLYFDKEEKKSASGRNAQLLNNFLSEKRHGISLLKKLRELEAQLNAKT